MCRDRFDHHGIRTDTGPVAHHKATQYLRARTHHDTLAECRVPLGALVEACAAQRDALIDRAVVTDFRSLADHHAKTVIDKYASTDFRAGMDFDPCQHTTQMRNETTQPIKVCGPQAMRQTMRHEGVQAGIAREHLEFAARCGVSLENAGYIFAKVFKHDVDATAEENIV